MGHMLSREVKCNDALDNVVTLMMKSVLVTADIKPARGKQCDTDIMQYMPWSKMSHQ